MDELRDLYQDLILDHGRRPRNFGSLPNASHQAQGYNPLCGDKLTVRLILRNGCIETICFDGAGCAISQASASLMTDAIKGLTVEAAVDTFDRFHDLVAGDMDIDEAQANLGKLVALAGVREFPMRVKCATLAWHTLRAALDGGDQAVTTE